MRPFCFYGANSSSTETVFRDKIAGSDFERLKGGPKGGGQEARSNVAVQ